MQPENDSSQSTGAPAQSVSDDVNTTPVAPPQVVPVNQQESVTAQPTVSSNQISPMQPNGPTVQIPVNGLMSSTGTRGTSGFKQIAKKVYLTLVSLFLVAAGISGLYANAKNNSWDLFITPFDLIALGLGAGIFYSYVLGKHKPSPADQSPSHRRIMIAGNAAIIIVMLLTLAGTLASDDSKDDSTKSNKAAIAASSEAKGTYTDPTYGFKITLPDGWGQKTAPVPGHVYFEASLPSGGGFQNIDAVKYEGQGSADLNQISEKLLTSYAQNMQQFQNLGEISETIDGNPAILMSYSAVLDGVTGKNYTLVVKKDDVAYVVAGWADADHWDQYGGNIKAALLSFRP